MKMANVFPSFKSFPVSSLMSLAAGLGTPLCPTAPTPLEALLLGHVLWGCRDHVTLTHDIPGPNSDRQEVLNSFIFDLKFLKWGLMEIHRVAACTVWAPACGCCRLQGRCWVYAHLLTARLPRSWRPTAGLAAGWLPWQLRKQCWQWSQPWERWRGPHGSALRPVMEANTNPHPWSRLHK